MADAPGMPPAKLRPTKPTARPPPSKDAPVTPLPRVRQPQEISMRDFEWYYREELESLWERFNGPGGMWLAGCKYDHWVAFCHARSSRCEPRDLRDSMERAYYLSDH